MTFTPIKKLTFSAILIALGVLIPLVMPVKVMIPPASYTLASHVPVFLAMFISPGVALAVALGTAFGFFLSAPFIIALRALSHVIFAVIGAMILQKQPTIVSSPPSFFIFNLVIGVIHAVAEALVVTVFFFQGSMGSVAYDKGFIYTVLLLVGVGGLIHSLIDYSIAYYLGERLSKQFDFPVFSQSKLELNKRQTQVNLH